MQTYIMLTRIAPAAMRGPESLLELERETVRRIEAECPDAQWVGSYAVLGPYDYLDIFRAPDASVATKVSLLVRTVGHATTEMWTATEWPRFTELIAGMKLARS
jgi:uncharacterized protein with GYD domain